MISPNAFYCIALHVGPRLTSDLRDLLLREAWRLATDHEKRKNIAETDCDGYIEVAVRSTSYCGASGRLFKARIDNADGTLEIDFLISDYAFAQLEDSDTDLTWITGVVDADNEFELQDVEAGDNLIAEMQSGRRRSRN